jgi:hypothetical protein
LWNVSACAPGRGRARLEPPVRVREREGEAGDLLQEHRREVHVAGIEARALDRIPAHLDARDRRAGAVDGATADLTALREDEVGGGRRRAVRDDAGSAEGRQVTRRDHAEIDLARRDAGEDERAVVAGDGVRRGEDLGDEEEVADAARDGGDVGSGDRRGRLPVDTAETTRPRTDPPVRPWTSTRASACATTSIPITWETASPGRPR